MTEREKHIHKYVRVKVGVKKREYYKCSLEGCTHKIFPELAVSRESICNYCANSFFMTKESITLLKPHCGCRKKKDKVVATSTIQAFLEGKI